MADATTEQDSELLAGLRSRRNRWRGIAVVVWAVLAVAQLMMGEWIVAIAWGVLALYMAWTWWAPAGLREVTGTALVLRRGLRTREIPRADVVDVRPTYSADYALVVSLRDGDEITLPGTALKFSAAAEQAAALRRWAGLS